MSIGVFLSAGPAIAAHTTLVSDTVVDSSALTFAVNAYGYYPNGLSFQQEGLTTYNGYQYAAYYNSDYHPCIARRQLPSGSWQTAVFTDYTATTAVKPDTHNVITIGISAGDGTIHLAFDHHDHDLHYRVSSTGVATNPGSYTWSTALFGSVTSQLISGTTETHVTYPRFISKPDGNLLLIRRDGGSGNGTSILYNYNASTHAWTNLGIMVSNGGGTYTGGDSNRNAYFDHPMYDSGGRLHLTWMWRETSVGSTNHDLNYAYSDDGGITWYNNAGTHVATTGSNPISMATTGIKVVTIGINRGLYNNEGSYVQSDGTVHIMTQHMPAAEADDSNFTTALAKRKYHHYWRNPSTGVWSSQQLLFAGTRPVLVVNDDGAAYMVFNDLGHVAIARGTAAMSYTDWQVIYDETAHASGVEPLIDWQRWEAERILSVYVQDSFITSGSPTPLRVMDYEIDFSSPVSPDGAPVGLWWLDDGSGTTARDISMNNLHGSLVNGPTWVTGVMGNAVHFDGTDDYVNIPDHNFFDGMATLTVSAWVKLDTFGAAEYVIVGKDISQPSYRLDVGTTGVPVFAVKTTNNGWYTAGTYAVGSSALTIGSWNHLVGTYDGTNVRVYINGTLAGTGSQAISGSIATGTSPVRLGYKSAANIAYYHGAIDEVEIYRTALNATEVAALYRMPLPVAEWKLDTGSGTSATDSTGNGLTGTLTNGPTWVTGKNGNAVQMDGTNDYINVPDSPLLDGTDTITVSAWVKLDTLPTNEYVIVGKDANGGAQVSYRLDVSSTGVPAFVVKTTANAWYGAGTFAFGATSLTPGTWYHIVGTYDGFYVKVYLNGTLDGIGSQAISGTINASTSPVRLGYKSATNVSYYDGAIDEVRIYPRSLNAGEVSVLYSSY